MSGYSNVGEVMPMSVFLNVLAMASLIMPAAVHLKPDFPQNSPSAPLPIRTTCKQVSSCEEAVAIWCNGYSGADRDDDGIPCENVCYSREQVQEIRSRQGC